MDILKTLADKAFWGHEFLTWLWFESEGGGGTLEVAGLGPVSLWIEDRMVLGSLETESKENILKDLHDGIGGLTTNINLLAELAQKGDETAIKRSLATIAELSRESLSEIRGFIQSLDSKELSWHAIAAELRYLGNAIIEPHGIGFTIDTKMAEEREGPCAA